MTVVQKRGSIAERLAAVDWSRVCADLQQRGHAVTGPLLTPAECSDLAGQYDSGFFRSHVVMARHGFGQGEYKYFAYPLPEIVAQLRAAFYPRLAGVANLWNEQLDAGTRYPADLETFIDRCHEAGQTKPTPLLLRYKPDDYNCLHQDLYGEHVFPLQATVLLSSPEIEFSGGEFVLTEQRPRMQSRAEVVALNQGEAVIFAVSQRPARGSRGFYRVNMRHGVSRLRSGGRFTLGIIFHDAR